MCFGSFFRTLAVNSVSDFFFFFFLHCCTTVHTARTHALITLETRSLWSVLHRTKSSLRLGKKKIYSSIKGRSLTLNGRTSLGITTNTQSDWIAHGGYEDKDLCNTDKHRHGAEKKHTTNAAKRPEKPDQNSCGCCQHQEKSACYLDTPIRVWSPCKMMKIMVGRLVKTTTTTTTKIRTNKQKPILVNVLNVQTETKVQVVSEQNKIHPNQKWKFDSPFVICHNTSFNAECLKKKKNEVKRTAPKGRY